MQKGRKFLSDLKLYSDYLGWDEEKGRYETWKEAVTDVFDTHRKYYSKRLDASKELVEMFNEAEKMYEDKYFLASQRNLQFRGGDLFKHHFRIFNCTVIYADKVSFLGNAFYLMLCGCGVGANMMLPFTKLLSRVRARDKGVKEYVVADSIEGWSKAAHVLVSSYTEVPVKGYEEYQGYQIKFDLSQVRKRGARIGRRFKAPGSDGLKASLDKIVQMMDTYVENEYKEFKSILAYDFFMHLADAVLSGGVRRAACSIICSKEDTDLVYAKSGDWRQLNKQRSRSNNSVGLLRGRFTKEDFQSLIELNNGTSDIGFVFLNNIYEILNPCFEIGFTALVFDYEDKSIVQRIQDSDETLIEQGIVRTAIQACNLNEINAAKIKDEETFYKVCRAAAITGTAQAGYTKFEHLEEILEDTVTATDREALLGVSVTGWSNSPFLFNAEILQKGAKIVKDTNEEAASLLGINPAARSTTVKPSGNAAVILECASGIHFEHSEDYFRVMQLNKDTDAAKYIEKEMPFLIEEGVYSQTNSDYAVFVPISNDKGTLYKNDVMGVKHLELIKLVKENWVDYGKTESRCIIPTTSHNVSNTVIIDDYASIVDYIWENQQSFTAVSFLSEFGDKDWNQSPNTSVLRPDAIMNRYGRGALFASGLVVDGLHYFNSNLWAACDHVLNKTIPVAGTREQVMLRKYWISRAKKFAKNYFKGNLQEMVYCLKDVHLYHKWETVTRQIKDVDFTKILSRPEYTDIGELGAMACSGPNGCEITRI